MERILIIGNGGAGKTTLAKELHRRTGLPLIHLDRHFWQAGWVECKPEKWRQAVENLIRRDRWIMDGNYAGTLDIRLARADTVIFLDRPAWLCAVRVLRRVVKDRGRSRSDMGTGCRERFDWQFLKYVLSYNRRRRPRLLRRLEQTAKQPRYLRLRNDRDVSHFLRSLTT